MSRISKELTANDAGETGAHQAGIAIPKKDELLGFFPQLDSATKNPRCHILFEDSAGDTWELAFIYYNNKFFGGTRNEYRLTRTTEYVNRYGLVSGDTLIFEYRNGNYFIDFSKKKGHKTKAGVLVLGTAWRVIDV